MVTQINDGPAMSEPKQLFLTDMCRICMDTTETSKHVISYELTPTICRMLNYCTQINVSFFITKISNSNSLLHYLCCAG